MLPGLGFCASLLCCFLMYGDFSFMRASVVLILERQRQNLLDVLHLLRDQGAWHTCMWSSRCHTEVVPVT
jgi:hypothetical protein